MIEYICDNCGERIDDLPEEAKVNFAQKHICKDCIRDMIRDYAKKIADAPLGYSSYDWLVNIYWNLEDALNTINHIMPPSEPYKYFCPTCGSEMKMISVVRGECFCDKCGAVYNSYGKKVNGISREKYME